MSQMMDGTYPKLDCEIEFYTATKQLKMDPYVSVNRIFSEKDNTLCIRCTYSSMDQNNIIVNDVSIPSLICTQNEDSENFMKQSLVTLFPSLRKKILKKKKVQKKHPIYNRTNVKSAQHVDSSQKIY